MGPRFALGLSLFIVQACVIKPPDEYQVEVVNQGNPPNLTPIYDPEGASYREAPVLDPDYKSLRQAQTDTGEENENAQFQKYDYLYIHTITGSKLVRRKPKTEP